VNGRHVNGMLDLLLQYPAAAAAQVRAARWLSCLRVYDVRHVTIGRLEMLWLHPDVMVCHRLPASVGSSFQGAMSGCIQAQDLLTFHDEHGTAALEARDAPQLTWEQVHW
jgi:hypothetical protein